MEITALNLETEELLDSSSREVYQALLEEAEEQRECNLESLRELAEEEEEEENLDNVERENENEDEDILALKQDLEHHKTLPFLKRPSIWQILLILVLVTTFVSAAEPFRQNIQFQLACNSVEVNGHCSPELTQILIGSYNQASMVGMTLISLLAVSMFGYSDIIGRKPFLVSTLALFTISRFVEFYLMTHYDTFKFVPMIVAAYVSAISGGFVIIGSIINAYISDVCAVEGRTYALALGTAGSYFGQAVGPLFGDFLGKWANSLNGVKPLPRGNKISIQAASEVSKVANSEFLLLKVELIIFILVTLYLFLVLPESRSIKARSKSRQKSVSEQQMRAELATVRNNMTSQSYKSKFNLVIRNVLKIFEPLTVLLVPADVVRSSQKHNVRRLRFMVIVLTTTSVLYQTLMLSLGQILLQYGIYKFDWGSEGISILISTFSMSKCFALMVVLPFYQKTVLQSWFGLKVLKTQIDLVDIYTMLTALITDLVVFLAFYFMKSSIEMYTLCGLFAIGGFFSPVSISAILKTITKIGPLFAANTLLLNIVCIVSPIAILGTYTSLMKKKIAEDIFLIFAALIFVFVIAIFSCKVVLNLTSETTDETVNKRELDLSEPLN